MSVHHYAIEMVMGLLAESELLRRANVSIISQNAGDLATLLEQTLDALDGPVAVVTVDRVQNVQPGAIVSGSVMVTENAVLNRERNNDFLTALDVAMEAQRLLDRHDVHSGDVTHSTPGDGVLEAVCPWEIEFSSK